MKQINWIPGTIAALALFSTACVAADYTIDWSTIDGGGGTSTGGVYTISGTIGQPDAGTLSGGGYTLHGGFWSSVAAIQSYGAPWLTVIRTATNTVAVWWPNTDPAWRLCWTAGLARSTNWTDLPPPYPVSGTNCVFVEPMSAGSRFYRLYKP